MKVLIERTGLSKSFNRYMVECEFFPVLAETANQKGFNRYMVECEFNLPPFQNPHDRVLIDTWWNVNVLPKTYAKIFDEF